MGPGSFKFQVATCCDRKIIILFGIR